MKEARQAAAGSSGVRSLARIPLGASAIGLIALLVWVDARTASPAVISAHHDRACLQRILFFSSFDLRWTTFAQLALVLACLGCLLDLSVLLSDHRPTSGMMSAFVGMASHDSRHSQQYILRGRAVGGGRPRGHAADILTMPSVAKVLQRSKLNKR
ncbi:hypothetical protein C8Q70DRAFT_362975 [Cubamyces menziesii]|nr:hypothetical protein C8Q70DRAFT_362975 [Cubamyces menziesii]